MIVSDATIFSNIISKAKCLNVSAFVMVVKQEIILLRGENILTLALLFCDLSFIHILLVKGFSIVLNQIPSRVSS